MTLSWDRAPAWSDPRIPFLGILAVYVVLGVTVLGFNRSPAQILLTVGGACGLDMLLHYLLRGRRLLFPLSAAITGCSLCILANYAHGPWLPAVPVFFAIASKYLFTFEGKHVYNPSLFGLVASLLLAAGMVSPAPAYQWGGTLAIAAFVVTAALVLFVFRIGRNGLILAFLGFYLLQLALRAWLTRWHLPPETLFLGAFTSPAFYLFTFFMITDPQTSPPQTRAQVLMALVLVTVDLLLHQLESLSTLFYAAFICFSGRLLWLHASAAWSNPADLPRRLRHGALQLAVVAALASAGLLAYQLLRTPLASYTPDFSLRLVDAAAAGIRARPGDVLGRVDPRIAHVSKWVLSVGDAVAVADADGDGLQDVFFTLPLKHGEDRAALYRNLGAGRFERLPLPALDRLVAVPEREGLPSGAVWLDYDDDGDADLFLLVSFGHPRLLQNRVAEERVLRFIDVTQAAGIDEYLASVAVNALDVNRDGGLDLLMCSAFTTELPGYARPTPFNVFRLPRPEYEGDRRMFNFMHRSWHAADNGGGCALYLNTGAGGFRKQDARRWGLGTRRWVMAIGSGDFNADGWTDLYLANDFGPDELLLNRRGEHFESVHGRLVGSLGRDTYKGMNAGVADYDNNGHLDVYISDVHEPLQAEGSLLWMNDGGVDAKGDEAFRDEALRRNALNERRFGWGAAAGDLDRDGRIDLIQANGMVDDRYDHRQTPCPDYWYWNDKIALTGPDVHGYADRWADLRGRCIFPDELNRVYLNRGPYFVDAARDLGWTEPGTSRAVALSDWDNDGDLDVFVTHQFAPPSLYENRARGNWIGLDLQGNGRSCNRDALGSQVTATLAGIKQLREVQASNGLSAQGDQRLLIGLGVATGPVRVSIRWCGEAAAQTLELPANRYHHLTQRPE